jgi:hypothetical protein
MLNFEKTRFRYDPFPIGFAQDVVPEPLYGALTDSFPDASAMLLRESLGRKYLLTDLDGDAYYRAVTASKPWRTFFDYVKSRAFVDQMLNVLCAVKIDLGLKGVPIVADNPLVGPRPRLGERIVRRLKTLMPAYRHGHLTSRFEFSVLPGDGGSHYPHTDTPDKVISLVLPMVRRDDWDPAWGGGTAVCKPRDVTDNFNHVNRYLKFDDVEVLEAFPFAPNSCVIFVKTFNSLHAVLPCAAGASRARKSVTISIYHSGRYPRS